MRLANNDKVSGALESIRANQLSFVTPFAKFEVPLQRVGRIDLAGEGSRRATNAPGDVRVEFAGRGRVTFELERWEDRQAVGTSPNFGRLKFDPAAFSIIHFNVHRPRIDADGIEDEETEGDFGN